jgi:phosphate transporter
LEKQAVGFQDAAHDLEANESTSLIGQDRLSTDALFVPLLDRELKKICLFYEMQEAQLLKDVESLQNLVQQQEDYGPDSGHQYDQHDYDDDEEEDDDDEDFAAVHNQELSWSRSPINRRRRSLSEANGRCECNSDRGHKWLLFNCIHSEWPKKIRCSFEPSV